MDVPAPCCQPSPRAAYARWLSDCAAAGWRAVPAVERVPVREALARVTAEPVRARWASPRAGCAAMDGIAIKAGPAACEAGPADRWQLAASSFTWVDTGQWLPPGMDTVVERERVRLRADGTAEITGPASRGRHVRAEGEDFPAGRLLIPAGHRLRPADLAAAAAAGHDKLTVARPPVAVIIPTGDEVRPSGSALGPGEITDSNSVLLAARATEAGMQPALSGVQPDDPVAIAAEVRRAARAADLVLVIAGSSAGRRDHTAAALGMAGGLAVRGVAVRPGHPVLLGHTSRAPAGEGPQAVPVIGVPGYPLAAAVIFELFAVPLLAALHHGRPERPRRRARLACDWIGSPDVEEWVPVSLAHLPDSEGLVATPAGRGAGSLSRLLAAHAWWPVPLGAEKFRRGERIAVRPISGSLPQNSHGQLVSGTQPGQR